MNVGKIGMSFNNLKRQEEITKTVELPKLEIKETNDTSHDENQMFTQEQVRLKWAQLCMRMEKKQEFVGLAQRMKGCNPVLKDFPQIEVVVDNQMLLDDILTIKRHILRIFISELHNNTLDIQFRLSEGEEKKRILSKYDMIEELKQKNPAIGQFCKAFNLTLS